MNTTYLKIAEELLHHLHGYRPDATDSPGAAFEHDRHLLASKLESISSVTSKQLTRAEDRIQELQGLLAAYTQSEMYRQ